MVEAISKHCNTTANKDLIGPVVQQFDKTVLALKNDFLTKRESYTLETRMVDKTKEIEK
jgi:hypothetical protein